MNSINMLFNDSDHIGAFNPFYFRNDEGKFVFDTSMENILEKYPQPIKLNPTAISSVLNNSYVVGDITCVKGIYRSPWMAKPNLKLDAWQYHETPKHGNKLMPSKEIAKRLFNLLQEEIAKKLKDKRRVGLLLSGGMDSRIVAGVFQNLKVNNRINTDKVVAYTWGNPESRDVVYARKISDYFGWQFRQYSVSADDLWENIQIAGKRGCEFSGLHLHAMPRIAEDAAGEVDIMLAASYGDSVGRAEFSGRHVCKLRPIEKGLTNFASLLPNKVYKKSVKQIRSEIEQYRSTFKRNWRYQINEIDQQAHYWRRMLNPCMEIIDEKVPLYQAFSHPKVFGFMWSLKPSLRNDNIYKDLLLHLDPYFSQIPWARTGIIYGESGIADQLNKKHHSYEQYLQNDLQPQISDFLEGREGSIINIQQLREIQNLVNKYRGNNFDYLEAMAYSISVLYFLEHKNFVKSSCARKLEGSTLKLFNLRLKYHLKRKARKLRRRL